MKILKFLKGLKEKDLPLNSIQDGSIYHCEDTGNTYLGKEIKNEDGTTTSRELLRYSSAVGKTVISLDDNEEEVKSEIFNDYINNQATGSYSHAEGQYAKAFGKVSHAEGRNTIASGNASHAEGEDTQATGYGSHAEGGITQASGAMSHAEGEETIASGEISHAEGSGTLAEGYGAHAEGCITQALAYVAHAEGENTIASGNISHAEGCDTEANGSMSHAEGYKTKTYGDASHAEGYETEAYERAHAEGRSSVAEGKGSHAEGYYTHAIGEYSHTEGNNTRTLTEYSHAEGSDTIAKGINAHAEGKETIAAGKNQHVQGRYNIEDTENKYAHIVGNGTSITDENDEEQEYRSNAHTLDWEGNAWFAGDVYVKGSGQNDTENVHKLSYDSIEQQNANSPHKNIKFWVGTQEELETIEDRQDDCLYFTTGEGGEEGGGSGGSPSIQTISLLVSDWDVNSLSQTVNITGIIADPLKQIITVSPTSFSREEYLDCGVQCISQGTDSLTFKAESIPNSNLSVYIAIQKANN